MNAPLILADWNGHLVPFLVATPLAAIGCLLLLIAIILSTSKRKELKAAKILTLVGGSLLVVAILVLVFGKDSVS